MITVEGFCRRTISRIFNIKLKKDVPDKEVILIKFKFFPLPALLNRRCFPRKKFPIFQEQLFSGKCQFSNLTAKVV